METSKTVDERVLVTGGSGFLGSWCLVELLRNGYQVRTTVRDSSREQQVRAMLESVTEVGDRLSVRVADLNDDEGWEDVLLFAPAASKQPGPLPQATTRQQ